MGLGKTLSMIALVASDKLRGNMNALPNSSDTTELPAVPSTLIIVPPPCTSNLVGGGVFFRGSY